MSATFTCSMQMNNSTVLAASAMQHTHVFFSSWHACFLSFQDDGQLKKEIAEALNGFKGTEDARLRFPISVGEPRQEKDHTGDSCTALDVAFNPRVVQIAESSRQSTPTSSILCISF